MLSMAGGLGHSFVNSLEITRITGDVALCVDLSKINRWKKKSCRQKGKRGPAKGGCMAATHGTPTGDLNALGITPSGDVYWNQDAPTLIELAVARNEGVYSAHRALVTETGERTGRSPNDKFIVEE